MSSSWMESGQETFEDYFDELYSYHQVYYEDEITDRVEELADAAEFHSSPQPVSSPLPTPYERSITSQSYTDYPTLTHDYYDGISRSSGSGSNVFLPRRQGQGLMGGSPAQVLNRHDRSFIVSNSPNHNERYQSTPASHSTLGRIIASSPHVRDPAARSFVEDFTPSRNLSRYQAYRQGSREKTVSSQSQFVSTSVLPSTYRSLFSFSAFNAVQSACFPSVFRSEENVVVSAPTGSGKTVVFELAIVKMLMDTSSSKGDSKCIYIAPTKALCAEKCRDWSSKYDPIGANCFELTGDTVSYGKGAWSDAKNARIILTTPEKLDSLSRNWNDHESMFDTINL
ncbi:Sec63, partial [Serendipita sp. 399]